MTDQTMWYIEHRIEYLENQLSRLRKKLDPPTQKLDFQALTELIETKGRVRELRHLKEHLQRIQV